MILNPKPFHKYRDDLQALYDALKILERIDGSDVLQYDFWSIIPQSEGYAIDAFHDIDDITLDEPLKLEALRKAIYKLLNFIEEGPEDE